MTTAALHAAQFVMGADPTPEEAEAAAEAVHSSDGFAPLVPFNAPVVMDPFPVAALPASFLSFVDDISRCVQVPPVVPSLLSIAVAAAAVAGRFRVDIGDSHSEPLNLFTAVLMDPGGRKSEIFARVTLPLEEIESELIAEKRPEVEKIQQRRLIEDERLKALRAQAAKTKDDNEREELIVEAEHLAAHLTVVPALPRLIVGDETPEHTGKVLAEQGGRVALLDADCAFFDIVAGRYNERPNIEMFLKAHAGDRVRVGRNSRECIYVERPALTIGVAVQPSALVGIAKDGMLRGRGLLGRFLWAIPPSLVGSRMYADTAPNEAAAERYRQTIRGLHRLSTPSVDDEQAGFKIRGAALSAWRSFHDELELRQADGGDLAQARDWSSKAAGAAARIAGIFHAVRHAHGAPGSHPVGEEDTLAGIAVVRALTPHALAVLASAGTDERIELARRIIGWAERTRDRLEQRDGYSVFSLRDAHRIFPSYGKADELLPSLEIAEARGYVRRLPDPDRTGPGRSPSPRFALRTPLEALLTKLTKGRPEA